MRKLMTFTSCCIIAMGLSFTGCNPKTNQNQEPIVETTAGRVSGSIDDGIFTFKGIPYAKAERFMPPQEPDAWEVFRKVWSMAR